MTKDTYIVQTPDFEMDHAAPSRPRISSFASAGLPYLVAVGTCLFWLVRIYHLFSIDLRIPFGWVSDNNFAQMLVKNFVRGGHYYINPLLGAPGQQELYDFPMPVWVHFFILAVIRLFTHNPGLAINLLYLLSFPLSAVTCLYAFRRLGISPGFATAGAVLFAFLPFHLLRAEGHLIFSCYYLVPLMSLVAVWIGLGRDILRPQKSLGLSRKLGFGRDGAIALATCFLVGWDNPYYAFFGAFLLLVAALLGWLRFGNRRAPVTAVILLIVIISSFGTALLPNILYVHEHGPGPVAKRVPVESEMYGMTVIQLLSPVTNHRIPLLANWKERYNTQALLVNENDTAALGAIGAFGFFGLLVCLFKQHCEPVLYCLAILCLSATLLGTIGGFGAIFSFLVSPQLRAFNRISVYIGFLCIAATMAIIDKAFAERAFAGRDFLRFIFIPVMVVVLGIHDQVPKKLMANRKDVEKLFRQDEEFVRRIELLVPARSMIFQLPYFPFPETWPINNIADYDELKGYLHSDSLRWSYGSMKTRPPDTWAATVSAEPLDRMLTTITAAGFAGLYVDRNGYKDHGSALETQLRSLLGQEPMVGEDGRLSFFPLDHRTITFLSHQITPAKSDDVEEALHPLIVDVGSGCWGREGSDAYNWHWCGAEGEIVLANPSQSERVIKIQATFASGYAQMSNLWIEGMTYERKLRVNDTGVLWTADLRVPPGTTKLQLRCDCQRVIAPADSREMFLQVKNLEYRETEPPT